MISFRARITRKYKNKIGEKRSKQFNLKAQSTRHSRVFNYALMHHSSPICLFEMRMRKNVCRATTKCMHATLPNFRPSRLRDLKSSSSNCFKCKNAVFSLDDDNSTCNFAVSMRTHVFTLPRKTACRANGRWAKHIPGEN